MRVIVDLIGIPQSDRDMIWEWSEAIGALFSLDETSLRKADEAIDAFRAYVGEMIHHLRATGEGPELARLLLDHRDNEAMTEDELVAMYLLILFGGSETTTNLLGNGFAALQRNRDQWDLLVDDPSLVRGAVEELIRYDSPHHYLPRVVEEDFRLHDIDLTSRADGDRRHGRREPGRDGVRPARRPRRAAGRTSPTTCPSPSVPTTASAPRWPGSRARSCSRPWFNGSPRHGC